ncbi:hypothetical protein K5J22_001963 [Campylobacter coli]|nr:hypothetical protein [Campylobacter coli]
MKKIILCSTQRSGSTMVVEDFRNSGIMGNPDEYFIPWQGFKEGIDIDKEIDSLFLKGTKHDVFSVKIMANQIQKVNFLLKNYSSRCNNILELFHDAYWIYIKRMILLNKLSLDILQLKQMHGMPLLIKMISILLDI